MAPPKIPDAVLQARRERGNAIRRRREALGLSRFRAAAVVGTNASNIQNAETGRASDALVRALELALDGEVEQAKEESTY